MKKTFIILMVLTLGVSAFAQEGSLEWLKNYDKLGLIPTPQKVELRRGGYYEKQICVLQKAKVVEQRVDTLPVVVNLDQAYQLDFGPKKIEMRYVGEEGRKNAYLTLEQLKQLHEWIRCITITDWPAYTYRGWMDDISRGPVPHQAFRQKQWQRLHALKFNFCNYYTEHTLYQPEFPDLAPAYAAECKPHPDEVINLQLFAHAEKTLRIPFYQYMMDSKVNFNPSVEETYDFLKERIAAAYQRIPMGPLAPQGRRPQFFIINCDETEQLGTGRAKHLVDSLGADQVYVDFINKCYALVNEVAESQSGKVTKTSGYSATQSLSHSSTPRIAMWGDIVAKNPAMMKQLPKDMIYIMWAYEPIDSFTHLIKPFKEQGNPFWVAASTGHSATMTSTPQRYIKNIANLFRDGYRDGAEGAMLTCWDDNGEALFDNSWHAQYWAAEMAWNPLKTDDPEELRQREAQFNKNFERLFYGVHTPQSALRAASSPNLGEQLDSEVASDSSSPKLGEGDRPNGVGEECVLTKQLYDVGALMYNSTVGDWYTSAALMEPLLNFNPDNTGDEMGKRIIVVDKLLRSISVDSAANPHALYTLHRIGAAMSKSTLRKMIYDKMHDPQWSEMQELFLNLVAATYYERLFYLKREYLRLWDQENGDYERYIVMNRYDDLAREVLELDRHVFVQIISNNQSNQNTPMVQLRTLYNDRPIYYTLDGSTPNEGSLLYSGPFPLERSATIKAIAYNEYGEGVITEQYLLSHLAMGAKITLNTKYSDYKPIYSGGGENALIDGQLGSNTTYADGYWQGYWGDSIDATIDFGKPTEIHEVSMRFMQNTFDWILAPREIHLFVSEDGQQWQSLYTEPFNMDPRETGMRLKYYTMETFVSKYVKNKGFQESNPTVRYLRVVVPNPGPLPDWHPAPGQPSYLFTDEIVVK